MTDAPDYMYAISYSHRGKRLSVPYWNGDNLHERAVNAATVLENADGVTDLRVARREVGPWEPIAWRNERSSGDG